MGHGCLHRSEIRFNCVFRQCEHWLWTRDPQRAQNQDKDVTWTPEGYFIFFFFFFSLKFKEKIYWRSEKQFLKDWLFQKTVATQRIASIMLTRALDTNTKPWNKPPFFNNRSKGTMPKEQHGRPVGWALYFKHHKKRSTDGWACSGIYTESNLWH